ncbi:MAG: hypothetical protein IPK55_11310 [Streptococcus sp.]|nr:hypothetical protein [Streptococcus sp.]
MDYPEIHTKFNELGISLEPYFYDLMTSLFANAFPTDTLFRIWDLIFMEFSSPEIKGKTQGICFIVAVSMFLIESAREDIFLSEDPSQISFLRCIILMQLL